MYFSVSPRKEMGLMSGSKKNARKSGSSVRMYTFLTSGKVKGGRSVARSYRDAGMRPCIPCVSVVG